MVKEETSRIEEQTLEKTIEFLRNRLRTTLPWRFSCQVRVSKHCLRYSRALHRFGSLTTERVCDSDRTERDEYGRVMILQPNEILMYVYLVEGKEPTIICTNCRSYQLYHGEGLPAFEVRRQATVIDDDDDDDDEEESPAGLAKMDVDEPDSADEEEVRRVRVRYRSLYEYLVMLLRRTEHKLKLLRGEIEEVPLYEELNLPDPKKRT